MTKTFIAVKMRQYSTLFLASLFSLSVFSATGVYLTTDNGLVVCSIDWDSETVICESSSSDSNSDCVSNLTYYSQLQYNLNKDSTSTRNWLESEISLLKDVKDRTSDKSLSTQQNLSTAISGLSYSLSSSSNIVDSSVSLYQHLKSVDCSPCSDGICPCSNQFAVVESTLSDISNSLVSLADITNYLDFISSSLGSYVGGINAFRYRHNGLNTSGTLFLQTSLQQTAQYPDQRNVVNVLSLLHQNLASTQASINNYLYRISQFYLSSISNNVDSLRTEFSDYSVSATNFHSSATNFFSFFIRGTSSAPVLSHWHSYNANGSYYNFLTNFYLKVASGNTQDINYEMREKTNWFHRVETLLASLVFADSVESTNTVDISGANYEASTLLQSAVQGVSSVGSASSGQLSSFRDTSQNIVSSLRSISASFSRVADPGTVHLVSLSSDTRSSSDSISFETSDIRNLVEACHCVTTLCWCFAGLLLLYYFLHWTVKTSYGLLMFAWGVVSAIFKH